MTAALEYHTNLRFFDVCEKPSKALTPLQGYGNKPLVSIEESVKPLAQLVCDIAVDARQAKGSAYHDSGLLTKDESAAIYLYTLESTKGSSSLRTLLNETLYLQTQEGLKPYLSYLKLLLTALFKLPPNECTAWQATHLDLSDTYKKGEYLCWTGFSSCRNSIKSLHATQHAKTLMIRTILSIECINAREIQIYSCCPKENEILLLPCTYFQVTDVMHQRDHTVIIYLRELKPPHILLEPPFHQSIQLPAPKVKVVNTAMIAAASIQVKQKVDVDATAPKHQLEVQSEHDAERCKSVNRVKEAASSNRCTHLHAKLEFCDESGVYVNPKSATATAIWYFYSSKNDQWFWTPYKNFAVWMSVFQLEVTKGYWKGQKPAALNIEIINYLATYNPLPPACIVQIGCTIEENLLKF